MKGERILYTCYFDSTRLRSEGRRVKKSLAVPEPKMADLERAAKKNGISYRVEEKPHPSCWMKREGRLVVTWPGSKEMLLKKVAQKLEKRT